MAADGRLVFAAYGNVFSAFARNKEVCVTELFLFVCLLQLVVDFFFKHTHIYSFLEEEKVNFIKFLKLVKILVSFSFPGVNVRIIWASSKFSWPIESSRWNFPLCIFG